MPGTLKNDPDFGEFPDTWQGKPIKDLFPEERPGWRGCVTALFEMFSDMTERLP